MKLLFIGNTHNAGCEQNDFLSDMLFHGFHELLGPDFFHSCPYHYMFSDYPKEKLKGFHGMGFTLYGLLDPKTKNIPDDIELKIKSSYFDVIVYGQITRCQDYLELVRSVYGEGKVIYCDGEDYVDIKFPYYPCFKRELIKKSRGVYPISFSYPSEKIIKEFPAKVRTLSLMLPYRLYLYKDEEAYYKQYQESMYGLTVKKNGWDCLRHLEILGNYCMPLFPEISLCPNLTMTHYPKNLFVQASNLYRELANSPIMEICENSNYCLLLDKMMAHFNENLTTYSMARYILGKLTISML